MFGISGILVSTDYRIQDYPHPVEVDNNLVIFSVNDVTDAGWSLVTQNNKFIVARNSNYNLIGQSYTPPSFDINLTTTVNGDHRGYDYPAYASYYVSYANGGKSRTGLTAGDHPHSITITINSPVTSVFPPYVKVKLYKRNTNSFYSLPIGTLVFGENLNISGLTATSLYDNKYLCAVTSDVGNTGGSISNITKTFTTSSAGEHYHDGPVNNLNPTGFNQTGYGVRTFPNRYSNDGHSHSHTGSITFSKKFKYVKLRTYKVDSENVFISRGMIFGFTTNISDPDWVLCDGQTVRGYTTPDLVDRYIMCGNDNISSHNVKPSENDDYNNLTVTSFSVNNNNWYHRHGIGDTNYQNITSSTDSDFHAYTDITHNHSANYNNNNLVGSSFNYDINHFNLTFYMYLP